MSVKWTNTKEALSALESKLKCFICESLPVDPQLLWCKHSFCSSCIKDRPKCPKCQFPITPQEMVPDIMLNKLLQAMRVAAEVSKGSQKASEEEIVTPVSIHNLRKDKSVKIDTKNSDEKANKPVNPARKKNSEMKEMSAANKESNLIKTSERSKMALRRSSRSSSRGNSPQKRNQNLPEASKSRGRKNSPQVEKLDTSEKKQCKPKSHSLSPPKAPIKNINAISTPKPKNASKNYSPILFSAKKAHHTNKVNSKGETPLQIACRQGKLSLVQQLLREGAEPNVKDYANWTPLCDAVSSGSLPVVRALLDAGAGVNTPANLNTTALVEAVVRRDRAMVELLMSRGADPDQRTALGNTPLYLADDELRAVMLSFAPVSPQPPPRVPATPRAVLVDATLPPPQLQRVMELCRRFNLTLSTEFTEEITHLVVEKSAANTCEASTAVMLAIVSGCSVVGLDWVAACLEAAKLVAVDDFEPCGTTDYPTSDVFHKARLNKEQLLPRLLDGCHVSLQHDQPWPRQLKADTVSLVSAAGAVYQPRQCDPERVPAAEATVMYHVTPGGAMGSVSHIILYQEGSHEPLLKYNMAHVKSLPLSWLHKCIQTFSITLE